MGFFFSDYFKKLKAKRFERLVDQMTEDAKILLDDREYDLILLYERGFVRANGVGQDITNVSARIESLVRKPIKVLIKPGTYFIALGNYQNMATNKEYRFVLESVQTREVHISATCINAGLPIPTENDYFEGVASVDSNVARFILASRGCNTMTIQAGVWALTDRMSRHSIKERLVSRDNLGHESNTINDHHIDEAKRLLKELGISNYL